MSESPATVIVGAGIAGLWTAWRLASEGHSATLLTKRTLADSASAWAQGGIAVAIGAGDSPGQHAADTLAAGDGLADPEAVRVLTTEGPDRVRELLALGAGFDRGPDGQLRFGLEAAHSRARILHAGGDRTGAALVGCLVAILRDHPRVHILERVEAKELLLAGERVAGLGVVFADGHGRVLRAPHVVLATGGVGQLYAITTNPLVATGDGWALADQVGAALEDLEFLQFHPTALKLPGVNPAPLVSEAVRGAGAVLVDAAGRRFALDADPRGELAPRDVLARAVAAADARGGAWLDARAVEDVHARFPGVTALLAPHGLDLARDLVPVAPALHYAMGGVRTDLDGRTTRAGLWAVGEVARTGVHGANRLASNSLLEGLVFADRVGRALAGELAAGAGAPPPLAHGLTPESGADRHYDTVRAEMRRVMTAEVGVVRTEASLARAEAALARLAAQVPPDAWRTRNQLRVAALITRAARRRRESRGGHRRLDYPPVGSPHQESASA
ncbi:MAG TPA: L-aspartate oxidase [Gemmatimonadales bacterium]|nr:L-aspartate oxidase [Gemmatimonadales bacterium]